MATLSQRPEDGFLNRESSDVKRTGLVCVRSLQITCYKRKTGTGPEGIRPGFTMEHTGASEQDHAARQNPSPPYHGELTRYGRR